MRLSIGIVLFAVAGFAAEYTTYVGDDYKYKVTAITVDSVGNTYLTGSRDLHPLYARSDLDAAFSAQPLFDVFVTKVDPSGNIVFTVTFGAKGSDRANAIALDPAGNIYVAGDTTSPDFPLSRAIQRMPGNAFVVKLSPDGGTILYSTYFGGALGTTSITALTTDSAGNLYLTGHTDARDFPHTAGMPSAVMSPYKTVAFIAKLSETGANVVYSGVIAGSSVPCNRGGICPARTEGVGITVDPAGNAYVAGNTNATDLPTTAGTLAPQGIGAFVAKVNAAGTGLAYLTYLGAGNYLGTISNPANVAHAIAVDAAGNAYVAGATNDPRFPATAAAYQAAYSGPASSNTAPPPDAFVAKLKPDGSGVVWATYLGGAAADSAQSIAVNAAGDVWTVGTTTSSDFPNPNGWSRGSDFVAGFSAAGSTLIYSARYPNQTVSQALALERTTGMIHAAGPTGIVSTVPPNGAPTMRVFAITNGAGGDSSGRIAAGEVISLYGPHIGPFAPMAATADSSGFLPTSLGGTQVIVGGKSAWLLYVSDSQINAVVPIVSNTADVQIVNGGQTSSAFRAVVLEAQPGIFRNPDGTAAALNQDGSLNSPTNPAKIGSIATIWATGMKYWPISPGQVATTASNSCIHLGCEIDVYGSVVPGPIVQKPEVLYAGAAPTLAAAITQINFRVPAVEGSFFFSVSDPGSGEASAPALIYVEHE